MSVPQAPQGPVPALGIPNSQDYPRLVFTSPYFETVALAELIAPAVTEAVEAQLPSLVPPFVDQAAQDAVNQLAVLLAGSTMQGPLYLNPVMPTQPAQAASMAYVDSMIATAGIPEVPPTPIGQVWARETGQWVPISQSGGTYLPLGGGTMQGQINMSGNAITNLPALPVMPNGAAPASWVLQQIASTSLYQGTWDMDTYTPDLTQLSTHVNAWTWIAITTSPSGVVIGPPIPGLQGQTVFNGDTVIYSATAGAFQSIHSGGLTLAEANALYLSLNGGQLSGPLLLNANATQPTQAVTLQQLQTLVAGYVAPDAPTDGQGYLRVGATQGWTPGLPLTGGVTTGPILLAGNATNALAAVPYQQLVSYTAANYLPTAGGTMVGPIVLAGNATAPLNPVTLTQLTSMLGSYLPLAGGTLTGLLTLHQTYELINQNSAAPPAHGTTPGPALWLATPPATSNGTSASALLIDGWGLGSTQISFRAAGGTPTAPSAVQANQMLGAISWYGYPYPPAVNFLNSVTAIAVMAAENWTASAQGTQMNFWVTPTGTLGAPGIAMSLAGGGLSISNALVVYNGITAEAQATGVDATQLVTAAPPDGVSDSTIRLQAGRVWGLNSRSSGGGSASAFDIVDYSVPVARMRIDNAGNTINSSGVWAMFSDPRLKRDVASYQKGLDAILALDPITFCYNGQGDTVDDSVTRHGLDALALQGVFPESVHEASGAAKHLLAQGTGPIVLALINAVKELTARLTALEAAKAA